MSEVLTKEETGGDEVYVLSIQVRTLYDRANSTKATLLMNPSQANNVRARKVAVAATHLETAMLFLEPAGE